MDRRLGSGIPQGHAGDTDAFGKRHSTPSLIGLTPSML
jgi:hypothetical protein